MKQLLLIITTFTSSHHHIITSTHHHINISTYHHINISSHHLITTSSHQLIITSSSESPPIPIVFQSCIEVPRGRGRKIHSNGYCLSSGIRNPVHRFFLQRGYRGKIARYGYVPKFVNRYYYFQLLPNETADGPLKYGAI